MKNTTRQLVLTAALMMFSSVLFAQVHQTHQGTEHGNHAMITPADIKWQDGPPSLPPGAQFAVIDGDAKKEGLFTMRIKMPAGYIIPAHWHPVDEHVTVISGNFMMGMGDKFNRSELGPLPIGSFAVMPAKSTHYGLSEGECIVQVHAMGPWVITYVNPADDPRKK